MLHQTCRFRNLSRGLSYNRSGLTYGERHLLAARGTAPSMEAEHDEESWAYMNIYAQYIYTVHVNTLGM